MRRAGIVAAVLAVAGIAAFVWSSSSSKAASVEPAATTTATAASAVVAAPSPRSVAAPRGAAAAAPSEAAEPEGPSVTVKAEQVIVRINGVAITGHQVVAFSASAGGEQTMTHEMFEFLRARAIDRELTTQAARAKGIELSAAQLAELEQVRHNAVEHGDTDPAQLDFEVAEARAGLLQSTLLARAGTTLDAAADPKLADEAQARYSAKLRAYLDDLAAHATVVDN